MITDGRVKGLPLVDFLDTKANITGLSDLEAGMMAYASDTEEFGFYASASWQWSYTIQQAMTFQRGVMIDLSADDIGLTIQGSAGQTSHLQVWEDSAGVDLGYISASGTLWLTERIGVGAVNTATLANLEEQTLSTTDGFYALRVSLTKTAGVTDASDFIVGVWDEVEFDQGGGTLGWMWGMRALAVLTAGTIATSFEGMRYTAQQAGGVAEDVRGGYFQADLNAGTVDNDVYAAYCQIDQEAAHTISGDAAGVYVKVDCDGTVTGTSYMVLLDERSGVDFGIYQSGSADNYLGGNFGLGSTLPQARFHVGDQATNYFLTDGAGDSWWVGGGGLPYGEIHAHDVASDLALAAQDTWYQIVAFDTNGPSNKTTPAHGSDDITIIVAGDYLVTLLWTGHSHASNDYQIMIRTNNGTVACEGLILHMTTAVAARDGTGGGAALCAFSAADTVEVWALRTDGGAIAKTLTTEHITLTVTQIGG